MEKVKGRSDDMLIIRGVNVFPTQIESILLDIGETEPHYQIIVERQGSLDIMEIWVEVSEKMFSIRYGLESLRHQLKRTTTF